MMKSVKMFKPAFVNQEIAAELYVSLATVKSHLHHLSTKLAARNRVELAAWAWNTGRMR